MEKVAMIIEKQSDVTAAVLEQLQQSSDPRFKEIMIAAVTHLHGFIRDARLSEAEFHQACALIARLGQLTTASHNEVVLIAGSDRKSTRLNSSHLVISYAVFCLKKKIQRTDLPAMRPLNPTDCVASAAPPPRLSPSCTPSPHLSSFCNTFLSSRLVRSCSSTSRH